MKIKVEIYEVESRKIQEKIDKIKIGYLKDQQN